MGDIRSEGWFDGDRGRVTLALIIVQLGYGGYFVLCKAALGTGVNRFVLAVYRDIIALMVLGPLAYFAERKERTKLTAAVTAMLLVSGLAGIYGFQVLFLAGLTYTSTAFAAAMQNSIPVITFIIAVLFRVEVIHYSRRDGQAQVLGIMAGVAGAMIMTLYKGPALFSTCQLTPPSGASLDDILTSKALLPGLGLEIDSWQYGALCLLACCICMGVYVNLQRPILKMYPAPVSATTLAYLIGVFMLILSGFFVAENTSDWIITQKTTIIAVTYAGLINSALNFSLQTWCCQRSGPILVTVFAPLQTLFASLLSLVFLGDTLYLGSVLGSILVLVGLYFVTWGQSEHRRLASRSIKIQTIPDGPMLIRAMGSLKEPLLRYTSPFISIDILTVENKKA